MDINDFSRLRIGHGYDVHRFKAGRPLIIGGVHIPSEYGLDGHSDADVLLHALTDALLGAAGMRDIGYYFPDSDDKYKNADSGELLKTALSMINEAGFAIVSADCTIVAQMPKFSPHIDEIRASISSLLSSDTERINVKATTEEGLGFTGAREGMAAHAVCLLCKI
ncbi:MAG: 2-C-methyl-D-erythritol 2,4-cyclodiphosphate synthase [Firmicutes bacterium]|nr:2-C-methyl-D-erythritol 2,4-cyclodiphosphate synthase [Bacillota bacterium]